MNPAKTHGAVSWSELMTPDPKAGAAFYSKLFGWSTEEMDMGTPYILARINGQPVAGIMGMMGLDVPPNWSFYVTVDDVDACATKASQLGAAIQVTPTDIPTVGRFTGFFDPQGAYIAAITYSYPDMPDGEGPDFAKSFVTHGAFSWFELRVPDIEAAKPFYKELFGWNFEVMDMPTGAYTVVKVGDVGIGGLMSPPAEHGIPPHWGGYVTVDDADAIAEAVGSGGGTVTVPPMDIPQVGRFAMFADAQGAQLAVIKYRPMEG